jgi:hypothetical protein
MGNKWNDQWWSLVKSERIKEERRVRAVRKSKRSARRKQKQR